MTVNVTIFLNGEPQQQLSWPESPQVGDLLDFGVGGAQVLEVVRRRLWQPQPGEPRCDVECVVADKVKSLRTAEPLPGKRTVKTQRVCEKR